MRLKAVHLANIRSAKKLTWDLGSKPGGRPEPGWHVVIGDNGSGKSTLLRSIALAMVGPSEAIALRQNWAHWLTNGQDRGSIKVEFDPDSPPDTPSERGKLKENFYLSGGVSFTRSEGEVQLGRYGAGTDANRTIWGGRLGWFCASYGPFRRFSGGDKDQEKLFYSNPRLARHLSIFGESVALSECLEWLQRLRFKQLEKDPEGRLLEPITALINQSNFLPHGTRLDSINSPPRGVVFRDGNGSEVPVDQLSDGYRSILSLAFELIRQLASTFPASSLFSTAQGATKVPVPGVVLIDEIDAHLHPTWQRRIGSWLCEHFPRIQFIVSTHSPLVCQAARMVYRLPRPGTEDAGGPITGTVLDRIRLGNVLDAYSTDAFGEIPARSPEAQRLLARLAELNIKATQDGLSDAEKAEQESIRAKLPTATATDPATQP